MFCGTLITQGSVCVFKSSMSSFKQRQIFSFSSREKKKQKSKIACNIICSQTGKFLGSGLKVPRVSAEPIGKNQALICFISSKIIIQNPAPSPQGQEILDKYKKSMVFEKALRCSEVCTHCYWE